jgi:hypothetical protein
LNTILGGWRSLIQLGLYLLDRALSLNGGRNGGVNRGLEEPGGSDLEDGHQQGEKDRQRDASAVRMEELQDTPERPHGLGWQEMGLRSRT